MDLVLQSVANAIIASAFYAIMAVGFSLAFGVMRVANYAHGEFFMLGGYTVWFLYTVNHWPFFTAVVGAIVVVGMVGVITERTLFRHIRGNILGGVIIGIGLMFILQVSVAQIWGLGMPKPVRPIFPGSLDIAGISVSWQRLIVLLATILILGALYFFLHRFMLGRGLRASAMDNEAASLQGININTVSAIALGLAAALAGVGGALMAPIISVTPYMGHFPLLICFIVVIVGGAGNLKGAIFASIIFGFLHTFVTTYSDSTIAMIAGYLFMFTILTIRPQGLMGYAGK